VLGDDLYRVYLFGSVAKGYESPKSDVDVLVVVRRYHMDILDKVYEGIFEVSVETGAPIEVITMGVSDFIYREGIGSPFIYEVTRYGVLLYDGDGGVVVRDMLRLAEEYYEYSRDAFRAGRFRLSVDIGHNALELLLKSLFIKEGVPIRSIHGGLVAEFGKHFILTGRFPRDFGKKLHRALDLRNKARYDPNAVIGEEDAKFILSLYEELRKAVI
jgi:predicted nucleotidyltransferase